MRNLVGIKPQDILLLMKLIVNSQLSQKELADQLQISQAEISHGLKRLKNSNLLNSSGKIMKEACVEFLVHAVKFICPAQLGSPAIGIPTSYAHREFKFIKYSSHEIYVWPHPEGKIKGISLFPIYSTLSQACLDDQELYKLASLLEMIRSGRAREKKIGSEKIQEMIEELNEK